MYKVHWLNETGKPQCSIFFRKWETTRIPEEVTCRRCLKQMLTLGITEYSKWNRGDVDWYVKIPNTKCAYTTNSTLCDHPRNKGNRCNRINCPIEI